MSKQQNMVSNGAVQVRRGKQKADNVNMEPKGECNLAVTQILHLHLYKTSSLVCLSGSFLSLFVSLISLSLLPFHVLWLGALSFSACFLYAVHSVCVCVNCGHPWGRQNDEEDLFESKPCQVLWYDSAWSYRHLVCLKGKKKVDLLFLFSLLPSLCFLFDPSAFSHFHTLSYSLTALELGENSCYPACTQASHLTSPVYPINHGTLLAAVCMDASVLEREKLRTLWVSDFETICAEGLRPP